MRQLVVRFLGKIGFYVVFIFGLLHYKPIYETLGVELTASFKIVSVCMFFTCVLVAGDEVIENAEKKSGSIVSLFAKISDIMTSVTNSLKKKDDGANT